jgi:SAM-dependent methyltransferase
MKPDRAVNSEQNPGLLATMGRYWNESLACCGFLPTARNFVRNIWEFLRESTPAQRRQRYGDAEYDWDYRVDTTSATVGWRERLLGQFYSAYQPTDPALFKEMMGSLEIDFQEFAFIDIGSGKGRVLLLAADYPFRRVLGIELFPALHRVAQKNLSAYKSKSQQCFVLETVCADAREFIFPAEPLVLYLFNPLPEPALIAVMANLEHSLNQFPRTVYVLYHNPLLEHVLTRHSAFTKIGSTHLHSLFRNAM